MAQPKIFVSHSHKDDAFATRLVASLRTAGVDAWMDNTDLGAGNFQERISAALSGCEWFLLVLTQSALTSPWVKQEVDAANRLKHLGQIHDLIFIKADPIEHHELPALWGVYNIFDAEADYDDALNRTLKAVGLASHPKAPPRSSYAVNLDEMFAMLNDQDRMHLSEAAKQLEHKVRTDQAGIEHKYVEIQRLPNIPNLPNLVPVGADLGGVTQGGQLRPGSWHSITLQNQGESMPSGVYAVLFPSSIYREILTGHRYDQECAHWHGAADVAPRPGETCRILLKEARGPLHGEMQVVPSYQLYAPAQPAEKQVISQHTIDSTSRFYSARLTITYRDAAGRRLASIYDLDADRLVHNRGDVWKSIAGPIEVNRDLRQFIE